MRGSAHTSLLSGRGIPAPSPPHAEGGLEQGGGLVGFFGVFTVGFSPSLEPSSAHSPARGYSASGGGADLGVTQRQLWAAFAVQLGCCIKQKGTMRVW